MHYNSFFNYLLPLRLLLVLWGFGQMVPMRHNQPCQFQWENASHIFHHCLVQQATQCRNLRIKKIISIIILQVHSHWNVCYQTKNKLLTDYSPSLHEMEEQILLRTV